MFITLLKKQLKETNAFYFRDKKTGKMRSKGAVVGFIILYAFVFVSLAFAFFAVETALAGALLEQGLDWLYYAFSGLLAIMLGTFGSVLTTYSTLYRAKDNDFLLSMPIKPSMILTVRMVSTYLWGLLYTAIVFVPATAVYLIYRDITVKTVLFPVLLIFIITLFVLTISCALGWVVAAISSKIKGKAFTSVLLSLLFLAVYYFCYFKANSFLNYVTENAEAVSGKVKVYLFALYHLGLAASGSVLSMVGFTLGVAALFALCCFILSKTFIKIVTSTPGEASAKYKEKHSKTSGVSSALMKKELRRFTTSSTYMLNCGLGLIIAIAVSILALVKCGVVRETMAGISQELPLISRVIPAAAAAVVMFILALNPISAPSVSLEGKNIWLLQSLPVSGREVLFAKEKFALIMNAVPTVISTVILAIVIKANVPTAVTMVLCTLSFVCMTAAFGLMLGIKKPNLDWTSEAVPVKQSLAVLFTLFGGWGLAVIFLGVCFGASVLVPAWAYLLFFTAVFSLLFFLITKWIGNKGAKIFEKL